MAVTHIDIKDANDIGKEIAVIENPALKLLPVHAIGDSAGNVVAVNSDGQLHVVAEGKVDVNNSTTDLLTAGATYTGTATETLAFAVISVYVISDVESATDGFKAQCSCDGLTWSDCDVYTIKDGAPGQAFSFQPVAKYFRVVYINGAVDQASFSLQTILKKTYIKPSSHRVEDDISRQDDAELGINVIKAESPDGSFGSIGATASGNLKTTDAESGLAIAKGDVTDTGFIHKFGAAPDINGADGFVDVWDGADTTGVDEMSYNYSTTADIDRLSSSSASDTGDIEIQGLDTDYNVVLQTITLQGQTPVALTTALRRVFRMRNISSSDIEGFVYCFVNSATTAGVPDDTTTVRAIIDDGNNQTLMAIYTIPAGKTGYMRDWYASIANKKEASSIIKLFARPLGQVFQLKHVTAINSAGSGHVQHTYVEPEIFAEKTDITMRADTSTDGVSISAGFDIVLVDN